MYLGHNIYKSLKIFFAPKIGIELLYWMDSLDFSFFYLLFGAMFLGICWNKGVPLENNPVCMYCPVSNGFIYEAPKLFYSTHAKYVFDS